MDHPVTHAADFFGDAHGESTKMLGRSLGNRVLTGLCIALSFAAMIPLASILYLVVKTAANFSTGRSSRNCRRRPA